ncbi:ferredoxin reductase [Actinomadura decatromicini]|uniref:Oxidoreductase n=1 Tax=Actinomadura decatromicini TaxID=2604572 RepID=A0A5D3FMV7_9ACTN|nr:ferredoxin reductase [Actinomadura decatromicini]TYK49539.1 oxidoreductase [Actinomadura decatromicini]
MARAAVPGRLAWRVARLAEARRETETARTLVFDVPDWPGQTAGQHVDLRLTADDGYTAQRSYSLSAPDRVELTVQRIADGEVSPYLTDVIGLGDPVELRGPVGGWFVWRPGTERAGFVWGDDPPHPPVRPVLLVAGGSGIAPLMAMIRARRRSGDGTPFTLLYSVRTPSDVYFADELRRPDDGLNVALLYTREAPDGWPRPPGRLAPADLARVGLDSDCFVCGPTGFVEAAADLLVARGHDPRRIKTERFG